MLKWIAPLNFFLTFLIIASLALIASDVISFRLTRLYPKATPKSAASVPSTMVAEDLMSFAPILEKGLFGKATQGKLSPVVQQTTATAAAPAPSLGDLILLGTAVGSYRETFALVQKAGKEERVFRLGDTVFETGPLVSVGKESAEILVNGKRVKIFSPTAAGADSATKQPQSTAPAGSTGLAAQVGAGNYVIDQRALNASLDNIGQAMTDARLLPSIKDGKVEGFRASEVKPQGIFGTIGIKNGDILRAINDFPIDSPEKAIQSFASLKGQSRIKLDLVRDGQPTTFNYDIR
ncbi:type II secretion system protein GspC [Geotalea toluenoxydans]|uniref:type II secretion system protein GspC n=1 Tax=Geotalea toluenoxydans TaxID=421624 RepID=UPI0006D20BBD|nr:type II secretion system protein GspC [Geotalea toluenoxydans]